MEVQLTENPHRYKIPWHKSSVLGVSIRNWWLGAFGRRAAFTEGWDIALDSAACKARDMGRMDIADEINKMSHRQLAVAGEQK